MGVGGTLNLTQPGRLYFYEPVSGKFFSGARTLHPDTWYHLVFVRSGRNVKVYLNGLVEIIAKAGPWAGGDGEQLTVGNRADYVAKRYAFGLAGFVDEVVVWDRPLEPGEVKEIYALAGPIPPPPTFALFADAPTPQACFLAQAGQAKAAIVIGSTAGRSTVGWPGKCNATCAN